MADALLLDAGNTGGLQVAGAGAADGGLVAGPGQLQYGQLLLGGGTSAGWRELVGWRDLPGAQVADSLRPQADGAYPGSVYGDSLTVTFTYLLRGLPDDKAAAVDTVERYAPMDGVERCLVVDDGTGPWFRRARVIGRNVPQDAAYRVGPVKCSLQFLCADPRRYALAGKTATVLLPSSSGGLEYPLTYPLSYGTSSTGSFTATNDGSEATPPVLTFHGPLTNPVVSCADWSLGFAINLADGETLDVDTSMGTVLLNGNADRLYTITNTSAPIERATLKPGATSLSLTATAGTGRLVVTYHDARM